MGAFVDDQVAFNHEGIISNEYSPLDIKIAAYTRKWTLGGGLVRNISVKAMEEVTTGQGKKRLSPDYLRKQLQQRPTC